MSGDTLGRLSRYYAVPGIHAARLSSDGASSAKIDPVCRTFSGLGDRFA